MPGTLPMVNKNVYRLGIMVAIATHAHILPTTHFDRKNYFYPDNPKAYQITQFFQPLARDGYIEVEVRGKKKRIGIHEMHIEEDAGKNEGLAVGVAFGAAATADNPTAAILAAVSAPVWC